MQVILNPYNPNWKKEFEIESKLILSIIKEEDILVEHIGSTSIVGLGAKPIIDILIGIKKFDTADLHINSIKKLGYTYISKHETIMPYRRFFSKQLNGKITHHIHLVEIGTEFWKRHLEFRNYLRKNKETRDDYYQLKLNLSKLEWKNGSDYADAKSEFIRNIELKIKSLS